MRHFVVVSPVLSEFPRGQVVTGDRLASTDEGLDRTVARGWVVEIEPGEDTTVVVGDQEVDATDEPDEPDAEPVEVVVVPERPGLNASPLDWVAYAERHGVDSDDFTRDEIAALFADEA